MSTAVCRMIRAIARSLFFLGLVVITSCSSSASPCPGDGGELARLPGISLVSPCNAPDLLAPVWSPDSNLLAVSSYEASPPLPARGDLYLLDPLARSLQVLMVTERNGYNCCPTWAPDGSEVAFVSSALEPVGIWTLRLDGDEAPHFLTEGTDPAWSPDGYHLAFVRYSTSGGDEVPSGSIWVLDLHTREEAMVFNREGERVVISGLSWSPDGLHLAFGFQIGTEWDNADNGIYTLDAGTGETTPIAVGGYTSSPTWSPDGELMAYVQGSRFSDRTLVIGRVDRSCTVRPLRTTGVDHPSWSPDGRYLAFDYDWRIYVMDVETILEEGP